jgi:hypothetical protein
MMAEKRPEVNYTMTWDCTFVIDGKHEEVTIMTDDFEDVFKEYEKLKKGHKSVVFYKHELHRKGQLVVNEAMIGIPLTPQAPVVDSDDQQLQGIINALGVPARRGNGEVINPQGNLRGNDQRIRNADRQNVPVAQLRHDEDWMGEHNRQHAAHMLREPPIDKV